jgi:hypothetical protein
MYVHEKYDLPYNNFHGSHKWSKGAKGDNVQNAASHIQQSVSQSVTFPIIKNMAMATK